MQLTRVHENGWKLLELKRRTLSKIPVTIYDAYENENTIARFLKLCSIIGSCRMNDSQEMTAQGGVETSQYVTHAHVTTPT